jgi:hypothetical protein
MADDTELTDLRARIARLSALDRARLLEGVFADECRAHEREREVIEITTRELLAEQARLIELEKQAPGSTRPKPFTFPPEAKREAG